MSFSIRYSNHSYIYIENFIFDSTDFAFLRFPTNYPNESLSTDDFELVILEGNFHPNVLRYLKDLLLREAENLIGQPMIFMLIGNLVRNNYFFSLNNQTINLKKII